MNIEDIARVCHEVNRAYCESTGDHSQQLWSTAPQWQKDSAILGVKFALANPKAGPDAQHVSWLEQKTQEGWRYGAVKDAIAKTHPCFLPYDQLPREQQTKDYLFKAVVASCWDL